MKFSICIPAYNAEETIAKAIDSVLNQTYENWELIITDDCSSDTTYEIAKSFHNDKIFVFKNKVNLGLNKNWNHSFMQAKGEWVLLLGHDDYLESDCLSNIFDIIKSNSGLGIISYSGYFDSINWVNKRKELGRKSGKEMYNNLLPILHIPPPSETFYNVKAGKSVNWLTNGYNYSPEMSLQAKLYKDNWDYYGIDKILVHRGKMESSVTTTVKPSIVIKDRVLFLKENYKDFKAIIVIEFILHTIIDYYKLWYRQLKTKDSLKL